MFRPSPKRESDPAGPDGYRAYVIGDIHGRLDLLENLLAKIHAELQHRPADKTLLVFVGDLIDRGPASAHVLERLRTYRRPGIRTVFLLGNHEEVLLRILGDGFAAPLDGGLTLADGRPLFGPSKTVRGFVLAILATAISAALLS